MKQCLGGYFLLRTCSVQADINLTVGSLASASQVLELQVCTSHHSPLALHIIWGLGLFAPSVPLLAQLRTQGLPGLPS